MRKALMASYISVEHEAMPNTISRTISSSLNIFLIIVVFSYTYVLYYLAEKMKSVFTTPSP